MDSVKLISDQAVGEGDKQRPDGLGFNTYADILANSAISTKGPFTIGVFGEWGTGKTSLLRLIQERLERDANTLPIWFNAWRYEKEDHPIVPLIATIIRGLQGNEKFLKKLAAGGKNLIKGLRAIAYGFSVKANINVPFIGGVEATGKVKDMLDEIDKIETDPILDRSLYYDAYEILANIRMEAGTKIVVIIDDLDRCFPEKAVKLLETIKLVLSQPGFVFIIGVARSVIEGYLRHRYKSEYGIQEIAGQAYLDKMVQMPFHIPPHDLRMNDFYKMLTGQMEGTYKDAFEEILPIIGSACANNPRSTIRFINNLIVDCAIFDTMVQASREDIPVGSFAISRSLQLRWAGIYSMLIASDSLCQAVLDWDVATKFQKALKSTETNVAYLANEVKSDPHLEALLNSAYGRDWLADDKLRIITTQFLEWQPIEEEVEPEPTPKKTPRKTVKKKPAPPTAAAKKPAKAMKRKPTPTFMAPMTPSQEFAVIVGKKPLTRTDAVKKLWAYIKKNNLQDSDNRRNINADENLKEIFGGKKKVNMFEMTKLVNKHLK